MSRERPASFVLLMTQTVSSVTQRRRGRGQFAALEPGNCKADSSALLRLRSLQQRLFSVLKRDTA